MTAWRDYRRQRVGWCFEGSVCMLVGVLAFAVCASCLWAFWVLAFCVLNLLEMRFQASSSYHTPCVVFADAKRFAQLRCDNLLEF